MYNRVRCFFPAQYATAKTVAWAGGGGDGKPINTPLLPHAILAFCHLPKKTERGDYQVDAASLFVFFEIAEHGDGLQRFPQALQDKPRTPEARRLGVVHERIEGRSTLALGRRCGCAPHK